MKTVNYIFLLWMFMVGTSCTKQLDTVPTDFVSSVNYYTNVEQFNQGVNSVYNVMGTGQMYQDALLSYMSYTNDEAIFLFNQLAFVYPSQFGYAANDANFTNLWNMLYQGINNANIVLEALDAPNAAGVTQTDKDNIRGQLLFLRGYYHFMLVSRWGAIPLHLSATKDASKTNFPRNSEAEVYAAVIADMTAAESLLPLASTLGPTSGGRVSKNTAQGMLARVCLSAAGFPLNDDSKYAEALKWSSKLINAGTNSLNPSYADLFVRQSRDEYYISENMWEVEFFGTNFDSYREIGFVGIRNGVQALNGKTYPGYGLNFLGASIALYDKYQRDPVTTLSKDLRRDRNITTYQWIGGTAANQVMTRSHFAPGTNLYSRWPGKWRREEETNLPRNTVSGTNFPLLRYADVLLMFAEAENHVNGPTAAAYNAINQVRERAYGTGYRVTKINLTNGGSGYATAPTVTIANSGDPNGASTACAYATVTGGVVTSITLVNMGGFYSATPPAVTITSADGTGSGATATANVEVIDPKEADLTPGLGKKQFLEAIMDERPRELAYESLRSHDLRRWNILIPTIQKLSADYGAAATVGPVKNAYVQSAVNITTRHLFYPIPPTELATNSLMTQNPGW